VKLAFSTSILMVLVLACAPETAPNQEPLHPLVGTWRLETWQAQDSLGVWKEEFGAAPRGYFVYGPTGFLSIHIMHTDGEKVTGCDSQDDLGGVEESDLLVVPQCYVGYFGSYRIDNDSTVVHYPTGGTIRSYIDSEQPRRFEVRGDSLWIQRSESVNRLLIRVR
jgi:hypothetical protein